MSEKPPRQHHAAEPKGELDVITHPDGILLDASGEAAKPDSRTENLQKLKSLVMGFDELAKKSGVSQERTAMQEAESRYLEAYKRYYRKTNPLERIGKEPENLTKLKQEFNGTRLAYAEALEKASGNTPRKSPAFEARLEKQYLEKEKAGTLESGADGQPISLNEYLSSAYQERQDKIANYIRFREVVRPLAQKKIEARKEALDAKGKNTFEKSLGWMAEQNMKLENVTIGGKKLGKNGARAVRIFASTVLVTGSAAAAGSFGAAGLVGLLGFGAAKFGRSMVGALAGASAGAAAGNLYEKAIGRGAQKDAAKKLKTLGKSESLSLKSLTALDASRETLTSRADSTTLAKKKALVQAITAGLVGAGTTSVLTELSSLHHAAETLAAHAPKTPDHAHTAHATESDHKTATVSTSHEKISAQSAPTTEPTYPRVSVASGQGANSLFSNFHKVLGAQQTHSPLVDAILKNNSSVLAHKLGFPENSSEGYMQPGDSLEIHGHDLVFSRAGHAPITLMHEDASGHVIVDDHAHASIEKLFHRHHVEHAHTVEATKAHPDAAASSVSSSPDNLPPGINPDSPAAADYLTHLHNAPAIEHATSSTVPTPEASHAPDIAPTPEHPTPSETSSVPETPPSPVEHAAETPVPESTPPSIDTITHSDWWSQASHYKALSILTIPADAGTPAEEFRGNLFGVLRESGIAPHDGELIDHYVQRAAQVIHENVDKSVNPLDAHVGIYQSSGHLVVHGGDLEARTMLGKEYQRLNPSVEVLLENPDGKAKLLVLPREGVEVNGQIVYKWEPFREKVDPISTTTTRVF
jgi:hypothetical protein